MKDIFILIVDDQVSIRQMITAILRREGYTNLHQVENGKLATQVLEKEKVDLIILDWDMPVMTGVEVLEWVEDNEQNADLIKLMLTARASKDNVLEAVGLGADNYIVKPFSPKTLLDKIEILLKSYSQEIESQ